MLIRFKLGANPPKVGHHVLLWLFFQLFRKAFIKFGFIVHSSSFKGIGADYRQVLNRAEAERKGNPVGMSQAHHSAKSTFPDRESNPDRGGESAES